MPRAKLNGIELHYEIQGAGTPIIFIHPPVLSSISFMRQMQELSTKFMTVRFDIRGHGKSQPSSEPITYAIVANDIKRLMDHLDIRQAYLCGYSTGGSIVLECLLANPDRALGGIVIGGISEVHDARLALRIWTGRIAARLGAVRTLALSLAWSNSDTTAMMWRTYEDAKLGNAKNMAQYYQASLTYNCTLRLSTIKVPVLLVYGAQDKGFHSYARLLHSSLPNSKLTFIENMKHQIPAKAAHPLALRIERFIQDQHRPVT